MIRNKKVTGARFALTISMSALVAVLFYDVGRIDMSDLIVSKANFHFALGQRSTFLIYFILILQ